MKSALLVTGGLAPPAHCIEDRMGEFLFSCAADSGLDTMRRWNMRPQLVVGDMDSLSDADLLLEYAEVERHPVHKDLTDTELGLSALRDRGFERIVVAGGGGGRIDHLLAIFALFNRIDGPDEWLTNNERLIRITECTSFTVRTGDTVSVFPLAGGGHSMKSTGLEWPLDDLDWNPGDFGVSNVAVCPHITIKPGEFPLVVIVPLEAPTQDAQ